MAQDTVRRFKAIGPGELAMAGSIFEPDVVLPTQWLGRYASAQMRPEARLMLAVLEDAVNVLLKYAKETHPRALKLTEDALRWIRGGDLGFFPFNTVVEVVFDGEMTPEAFRDGLFRAVDRLAGRRILPQRQRHMQLGRRDYTHRRPLAHAS